MKGKDFFSFLNSPWLKTLTIVAGFIGSATFITWTNKKTMRDGISDYAQFQFSTSVKSVLSEKGGVMDQLNDIKGIATDARNISVQNKKDLHDDWKNDLQECDKRLKNGQQSMVVKENISAVIDHWKKLDPSEKDDLMAMSYNNVISFYDKVR